MTINRYLFPGCVLCALTTYHNVTAASTPGLNEEDFIGEIPVALTATRLAQPVTEAPAAITILDREAIQASGAREIAELFRLIPGFLVSHDDGHSLIVTYHGLADEHVARLQVLVDGRSVYSPVYGKVWWTNLSLSIDDIDHIEVIRGPNTVTYGSNSFLSVINIVTRHTAETSGAYARITSGTDGIKDEYARFGVSNGDLDYRITVGTNRDDGFADRVDSRDISTARARLDYQTSAKSSILAQAGLTKGNLTIDSRSLNTDDQRNIDDHFAQLRWQQQISSTDELSLQLFFTREHADQKVNAFLPNPLNPSADIRVFRDSSTESERLDFELQHIAQISEPVRVVWGAGARQDSAKGPQIFGVEADPVYTGYPGNRDEFFNKLYRLFGNMEWRVLNNTTLNLGAMWEKTSFVGTDLSPRLGVNVLLTPGQSIRLVASRATRTPSINEAYSNFRIPIYDLLGPDPIFTTVWAGNRDLKPEKVTAYEIGYHISSRKTGINADIKAYREIFRDLITRDKNHKPLATDPLDGQFEQYDNLSEATVKGVELSIDYNINYNTRVLLSGSYASPEGSNPNLRKDALADTVPRHIVSAMIMHRLSGKAMSSWQFYKVSPTDGLGSGNPDPGYRRINMKISIPHRLFGTHGEAALVVENFNNEYIDWRNENFAEQREYFTITMEW